MTQMFSSSFWHTNKIYVKKFGCSPVHPEQHIPVHKISLPEEKRTSLLAVHAITGCNKTSQFTGIGKQSALKIFDSSSKLIEHLGEHCPPEESVLADAEAFVCQLYNHGTDGVDLCQRRESSSISQGKEEHRFHFSDEGCFASSYMACELPVYDMEKMRKSLDHPCLVQKRMGGFTRKECFYDQKIHFSFSFRYYLTPH